MEQSSVPHHRKKLAAAPIRLTYGPSAIPQAVLHSDRHRIGSPMHRCQSEPSKIVTYALVATFNSRHNSPSECLRIIFSSVEIHYSSRIIAYCLDSRLYPRIMNAYFSA
ncbi:MAG: hypothetical protein ACI8PT_002988 [Gammaproteobacteria bacterium]|jgi:hypothetical protein